MARRAPPAAVADERRLAVAGTTLRARADSIVARSEPKGTDKTIRRKRSSGQQSAVSCRGLSLTAFTGFGVRIDGRIASLTTLNPVRQSVQEGTTRREDQINPSQAWKSNMKPRTCRLLHASALWAICATIAECKDDIWELFRKFKRPKTPKPQMVDDFLSPEEAAHLLDRYEFLMKESRSLGYVKNKAAGTSNYRTSRSVRLPPLGDPITLDIERRAADLAGFNHSYVEDLQMACYEEDELHGLHRDDADAEVNAGYARMPFRQLVKDSP